MGGGYRKVIVDNRVTSKAILFGRVSPITGTEVHLISQPTVSASSPEVLRVTTSQVTLPSINPVALYSVPLVSSYSRRVATGRLPKDPTVDWIDYLVKSLRKVPEFEGRVSSGSQDISVSKISLEGKTIDRITGRLVRRADTPFQNTTEGVPAVVYSLPGSDFQGSAFEGNGLTRVSVYLDARHCLLYTSPSPRD